MQLQTKLRTIQSICWTGAAVDAFWGIALLYPRLYGFSTGNALADAELSIRLLMATGASLMIGWSLILLWVSRNPVERRTILLITVVPVLASLMAITLTGILNGHTANIWIFCKCCILTAVMTAAYCMASTIAREAYR